MSKESSSGKKGSFSSSFKSENTVMMGSDSAPVGFGFSHAFEERFETLTEVTQAIKDQGIEHCSLIFGIDYTMSNRTQGANSFGGRSLHHIRKDRDDNSPQNPYQQVICTLGETLEPFNDDDTIPAFGFGDRVTKGDGVFSLKERACGVGDKNYQTEQMDECDGFSEVLEVYDQILAEEKVKLAGPTNFVPLIEKAIEIVKQKKRFHILVIVADGQVTDEQANVDAIQEASYYPLSIIVIGVGDGPWEMMVDFDKKLKNRQFDNFRFVNFHETCTCARNPQAAVALSALQLIPDQYNAMKDFKLLERMGKGAVKGQQKY